MRLLSTRKTNPNDRQLPIPIILTFVAIQTNTFIDMIRIFLALLTLVAATTTATTFAQPSPAQQKVFTQDIDNFWQAYDSAGTTTDSLKQLHFVQTLYIDKGTPGLKAFMEARDYSAGGYVRLMRKYPRFWASIRPNTLVVKTKAADIEHSIAKLKTLYPGLKEARMYFTIGGLRSGGTTKEDMVLVGAEIATGNASTDVSEFPDRWLAGVFKEQVPENLISLNVHEYVHTQQDGDPDNLLGQAIKEGSCDFVAELVMGSPLQRNYITYGTQHERELKETFKAEMFTKAFNRWLYNGGSAKTVADLGYFMGYAICKSFYNNAASKTQAIKQIIEINYADTNAVETFLKKSGYYPVPFNRKQLLDSFQMKQPVFVKLEPFQSGDTLVDASLKQMTIVFSQPMGKGYSLNYSDKGQDFWPISGVVGFSPDKKELTLNIDLRPGHEYEFIITDRSFQSAEGYPLLKDYEIKFKTRNQ